MTRHAVRSEGVMWAAFGGFVAAYLLLTTSFGDAPWAQLVLAAGYVSIAAMAVLAMFRVLRASAGVERRAWSYLTAAVAFYAVGDVIWTFGQLGSASQQGVAEPVAYILYAAACLPLMFYVITLLASALSGAPVLTKTRYTIDLAIAGLLAATATFVGILLPRLHAVRGDAGPWALNSALTLLGVLIFAFLFASILESRERLWMRWEAKVLVGIGLFVLADIVTDSLSGYRSAQMGSTAASLTDVMWMSAYFMMAVAASQRLRMRTEPSMLPTMAHARRVRLRWYDFGMGTALVSAVPFILFQARYGTLGDVEYWTLGVAAFVAALLVIARSVVLASENGTLLTHTVVDPLTGAYNHRFFQESVGAEVERARRSNEPLSILFMDIDGFAAVNEALGHQRGDQCLVRVNELLRMHERITDTVCRMGGDEFAIIMPSTSAEDAAAKARTIQEAIAVDRELADCLRSVSVGIATCPEHATERLALVAKADGALYWARATGTGQVVVYDDRVVQALSPEERLHMAEEQSYMNTVEMLAAAVDARDRYTQHHSRNVSRLAGALASSMGLAPNHIRLIEIAGLLHDVGKIGVPDAILRKPGKLTAEERRKIEEHPDLGQRILNATVFKEMLPWILSHHECWDGSGYPQGLVAEAIPFEARLLSVCDAYDAMVSDRPYREGMPHAEAIAEIERSTAIQFDPVIAQHFLELCGGGVVTLAYAETEPAVFPLWNTLEPELS